MKKFQISNSCEQVHISDHSRMVLTLNFNRTIQRCVVVAKTGNGKLNLKQLKLENFLLYVILKCLNFLFVLF